MNWSRELQSVELSLTGHELFNVVNKINSSVRLFFYFPSAQSALRLNCFIDLHSTRLQFRCSRGSKIVNYNLR